MEESVSRSRIARVLWAVLGFVSLAMAVLGAILPGLPTTVFLIGAAACFSRSSPRLERWLLDLPGVRTMIEDHRAGLGMPRRAKVVSVMLIVAFSAVAVLSLDRTWLRIAIGVAAVTGILVVTFRVPTKEAVLRARRAEGRTQ